MGPGVMRDGVALRPRSRAPVRDVRRPACRSGRTWRARIPAPAPPASSGPSPATVRHRRSARPRDPPAAASAESSSGRRAAWWRHRRRERARCRARPCAGIRRPAPPRSQAIEARPAAHSVVMNFRSFRVGHIWHCAGCCRLGNACSDNSDEFSHSVKPARRGMAEDIDVAQADADLRKAPCSTVSRCGMKRGRSVTNSSRRSRAPSTPPTGRCCARWWRNCTRPISAI